MIRFLSIFLIILAPFVCHSQGESSSSFESYLDSLRSVPLTEYFDLLSFDRFPIKSYDLEFSIPKDFSRADTVTEFIKSGICNGIDYPYKDPRDPSTTFGSFHPMSFISPRKDCIFLYPFVCMWDISDAGIAEWELKIFTKCNNATDIEKRIFKLESTNMAEYSNADTAIIYDFEFDSPYLNKYNHCIGIVLTKYAHPMLNMKIVLNDEGWKHKDYYIRLFLDNAHYGNAITRMGLKALERNRQVERNK